VAEWAQSLSPILMGHRLPGLGPMETRNAQRTACRQPSRLMDRHMTLTHHTCSMKKLTDAPERTGVMSLMLWTRAFCCRLYSEPLR